MQSLAMSDSELHSSANVLIIKLYSGAASPLRRLLEKGGRKLSDIFNAINCYKKYPLLEFCLITIAKNQTRCYNAV